MGKPLIFFGLSLLLAAPLPAQFILPGELFEERFPVFNRDSIRQQHIRTITIHNASKPSSRPIDDRGRRSVYSFDTLGRLRKLHIVFPSRAGRVDTITRSWNYENGQLVSELESTGNYQRRTRYTDSLRTIEVLQGKGEWQSVGKEIVQRDSTATQEVFTISTPGNAPYEKRLTVFNSPRVPGLRETWNGPRIAMRETWEYTDSTIVYRTYNPGSARPQAQITYVLKNGIIDHGEWCQRDRCRRWSILYGPGGLPKGWFFIDPETQDMEIWEFDYVFRSYSTKTDRH